MELAHPAWLGAWAAVVAVAILARRRPARSEVTVASLQLWREAIAGAEARQSRRKRRTRLTWWLLLIGALLAAAALAQPRYRQTHRVREVALELRGGLELATGPGRARLMQAVDALTQRMAPADRVHLLLPGRTGALELPAADVDDYLQDNFRPADRPSRRLRLPSAPAGVARLYTLAPGGADVVSGPEADVIHVASDVAPVRIGGFAGRFTASGAEILVSVTNDTPAARRVRIEIRLYADGQWRPGPEVSLDVPSTGLGALVVRAPKADAYAARLGGVEGLATKAWLATNRATTARVALVGEAQPDLRRALAAGANLDIVGDQAEADVVVSYQAPLPAGASGIAIDSPEAPAGFTAGGELPNVRLGEASLAGDHPLLDGVDLRRVAVRRLDTWRSRQAGAAEILGQIDGHAFLVASSPRAGPRRVHLSLDLSGTNTNLTRTAGFVVLLANALEWLAPGAMRDALVARAPHQIVHGPGWTRIDGSDMAGTGLWRGAGSELRAVTWPRLDWGPVTEQATEQVEALELPRPRNREAVRAFWPWLLGGALVCWLSGWWLKSQPR